MTYVPIETRLGVQPIAVANIPNTILQSGQSPFFNQEHPLGTIIRAYDGVYGEGEFIYLQSVASTVVGSVVTFGGWGTVGTGTTSQSQFQAALAAATANQGRPLAVAMAAFPSGSPATAYGWFQISGNAVVATNGTLAAGPGKVYLAGSGQVTSSATAGEEVVNSINVTATGTPATGQAVVAINRPFAQGAIT
jgi:hypothetical protein